MPNTTAQTTSEPITGTLTADDLAALRMADDVTLHHWKGEGHVRARLRHYGGGPRIYTAREQRLFPETTDTISGERVRSIPVVSSGYGYIGPNGAGTWRLTDEPGAGCFASPSRELVRSVALIARAGDVLSLRWVADNNTDNIRAVNYHADEVHAVLSRKSGAIGGSALRFLVDREVGPDNSARMIRRHG